MGAGVDDNCDGEVDEGNPGGGDSCNEGFGTVMCVNGELTCVNN